MKFILGLLSIITIIPGCKTSETMTESEGNGIRSYNAILPDAVNPPAFRWELSADHQPPFVFELSNSADFDPVIHQIETSLPVAVLGHPVSSGTWYWRVKDRIGRVVENAQGDILVPDHAVAFKFPDVDAHIRQNLQERPRLLSGIPRIESLRGSHLRIARNIISSCDKVVGQELLPEPVSVSSQQAKSGAVYRSNWRAIGPQMQVVESCAIAFKLSGNGTYLREASRRLSYFFSWDREGTASIRYNDELAMRMFSSGVRAFDLLYDDIDSRTGQAIERAIRDRAEDFYNYLRFDLQYHVNPHNSHANRMLGFLGEVSLSFLNDWPESVEYLDYVLKMLWAVYPAWADSDGGWSEGPAYWTYYMANMLYFTVPLKKQLGIDVFRKPFFQNTGDYKLFTNPVNTDISPFGDEEHKGPTSQAGDVMHILGAMTDNPHYLWYASKKNGPLRQSLSLGLLRPKQSPIAPADIGQVRYFPGIGLVSLHTKIEHPESDIHLLFHSNPRGSISHAHPDQNAYTLTSGGRSLLIASGYYPGYGSPHHKSWQWESRSSNTVTYDGGKGQVSRGTESKGRITNHRFGDTFNYVVGDATPSYGGALSVVERHIIDLKNGVYVIHDIVGSDFKRRFELNLHSKNRFALDGMSNTTRVQNGSSVGEIEIHGSTVLELSQSDKFTVPVSNREDQWHLVAATKEKATNVHFTTIIRAATEENNLPNISAQVSYTDGIAEIKIGGAVEAAITIERQTGQKSISAPTLVDISVGDVTFSNR